MTLFASVPVSSTATTVWKHLLLFSRVPPFEFLTRHSNELQHKVLEKSRFKTRIMFLQYLKHS